MSKLKLLKLLPLWDQDTNPTNFPSSLKMKTTMMSTLQPLLLMMTPPLQLSGSRTYPKQ